MLNVITLVASPKRLVGDMAKQAVDQANRALMPVRFNLYGVTAIAMPGDSVDGVLSDWTDDFDIKDAAAGSSQA